MPFWKKAPVKQGSDESGTNGVNGDGGKPKEKVDYKARLQHKQYIAQESPEPLYDVSDCGLKNVPSGVYIKVKMMLKEALLLQDNELTALNGGGTISDMSSCLQVLDLHNNCLEKLPDEIGSLKQLKVLHLNNNKLKKIPESIGNLQMLQTLNLSHNSLKDLPDTLSNLSRLKTFDITYNPKLKKLPKSLAKCHAIEKFLVTDGNAVQYPSSDICQKGTEAIMKFLCKECDIEYISPSNYKPPELRDKVTNGEVVDADDHYERLVRGSLKVIEKQKEDKMKEMLLLEKEREEAQAKEALLAVSMQEDKKKLLDDLTKENAKIEAAVKDLQKLKDQEKAELLNNLHGAEDRADALIQDLITSTKVSKSPQEILKEMEAERKEMEEQFTIRAGEAEKLREQEVLRAMQSVMAEEMRREQMRREYEVERKGVINSAMLLDSENDKAIEDVLESKGKHQSELINGLLEDEKYQREAFKTMFLAQDVRSKEIATQVESIQAELTSLTMVEMTKTNLKVEFENQVMKEKREQLTAILIQLMDQKKARQEELTTRLSEMEENRTEEQDNYWLIQYQKLLDSKPKGLVEAESKIEPALRDLLKSSGAEEYIPVLATRNVTLKQLSYMKDKELMELGMHNLYLRQKVIGAVEQFTANQEQLAARYGQTNGVSGSHPSAPPQENVPSAPPPAPFDSTSSSAPSAPPIETFQSTECCVCMERKCDIIFLPCGHVCCCIICENNNGNPLQNCPLCRTDILQKVRLR